MVPKHSRLSREAFLATFKVAKRARGAGIQVLYTPAPTFKASVVVSKKVAPLAVSRNRIRRVTYATLRHIYDNTPLSGHYIVIFLPESKKYPLQEVIASLEPAVRTLLPSKNNSR